MSNVRKNGSINYELHAERDELVDARNCHIESLINLRRNLIAYYNRRRKLRNEIAATHKNVWQGRPERIVVGLQLKRRTERANVFPELDCLNAEYAPSLREISILRAQIREIDSKLNKIEKMLA